MKNAVLMLVAGVFSAQWVVAAETKRPMVCVTADASVITTAERLTFGADGMVTIETYTSSGSYDKRTPVSYASKQNEAGLAFAYDVGPGNIYDGATLFVNFNTKVDVPFSLQSMFRPNAKTAMHGFWQRSSQKKKAFCVWAN